MSLDPYAELGCLRDASDAEIEEGFRRAAKRTHPDKPGGDAEAFERVTASRAVLLDPIRRRHFDETGTTDGAPTIDEQQTKALALIAQAFESAMNQPDGLILNVMRQSIIEAKSRVAQNQAQLTARLKRYEGLLKRFVVDDGKPNHIEGMIKARVAEMRRNEAKLKKDLAIADIALAILADYRYDGPQQAYAAMGAFMPFGIGPFAQTAAR